MTVVVEDPLIAGMAIQRILPLHESSRRLRTLYPECPRVYGVAIMADVSRRRWWPLHSAVTGDRLREMFDAAAREMDSKTAAAQQLAATVAHAVIGRVVALVVLEGRAWDTGLENLWVHVDSDGAIDWLGVVDPTLRVLPDDPCLGGGGAAEGVVGLPSEAALATWIAHRCHRSLEPLFATLHDASGGAVSIASMWHTVGTAIVVAATQVPMLAGSSEIVGMRRGQAVLDALVRFGLPVRGQRVMAARGRHSLRLNRTEGLAKLGQPCLC
ncbi:iron reductase [Mycolicibacterium komossense]|uniref:iron reductase n=1 Tax=Mycolicibacterium komossense TaxID=1779 RepID=UPI0021F2D879|nr:iron reductase [Mycolicibacterium komossense]